MISWFSFRRDVDSSRFYQVLRVPLQAEVQSVAVVENLEIRKTDQGLPRIFTCDCAPVSCLFRSIRGAQRIDLLRKEKATQYWCNRVFMLKVSARQSIRVIGPTTKLQRINHEVKSGSRAFSSHPSLSSNLQGVRLPLFPTPFYPSNNFQSATEFS